MDAVPVTIGAIVGALVGSPIRALPAGRTMTASPIRGLALTAGAVLSGTNRTFRGVACCAKLEDGRSRSGEVLRRTHLSSGRCF